MAELREKVNKFLLKNDFVFIRITGGLLLTIEGNYSVLILCVNIGKIQK